MRGRSQAQDRCTDMSTTDTAHSLLGASGASRWLNCPGSFRLSQTVPAGVSSIYAATGTLAHAWIERVVADPERLAHLRVGDTYQVESHTITIDQDFIDGIKTMLDYVTAASVDYDMRLVEQ